MSSLIVLWLSFTVAACNLSSNELVWYLIFSGSVAGILFTLGEEPWIRGLFGYVPQLVFRILLLSLLVTFVVAFPETIYLIVQVPGLATYSAWEEVSFTSSPFFSPTLVGRTLILLMVIVAGLGSGLVVKLSV